MSAPNKRKTVYQRIVAASKRYSGLRLSAEDVQELAADEMIIAVALRDDDIAELAKEE